MSTRSNLILTVFRLNSQPQLSTKCSYCQRYGLTTSLRYVSSAAHKNNLFSQITKNRKFFPTPRQQLSISGIARSVRTDDPEANTNIDPFQVIQDDLSDLSGNIRAELSTTNDVLSSIAQYHFDGKGKLFRPMICLLMARACNLTAGNHSRLINESQFKIAQISEMIHVASLIHDDVIDKSDLRRGQNTVHKQWGQRKAIMAGDYILAISSMMLARIGNTEVVEILAGVLEDLVNGEFMQLGSKENASERYNHYLTKTFKKTASLIANSCKAVAVLSGCPEDIYEIAYLYGRNIGMAFQLVDDLLDFISNESIMGKPSGADMKLGLATAPVLFAAEQFPELNQMIMRRFNRKGDVHKALELVNKSDGVNQARFLAEKHCQEAIRLIAQLVPSVEKDALICVSQKVLNRLK